MKQNFYHILLNLAALSVLSCLGVDIFYRALSIQLTDIQAADMAVAAIPKRVYRKPPPLKDFDVILERNIFGAAETSSEEAKPREMKRAEIEALAPTSLNIALLGTVSGSDENARAVIEDAAKKTQGLYRVGDTIQSAIIHKIVRGKVVLRVGENDEVLSMESPEPGKRSTAKGRPHAGGETITVAQSDIQESLQNINQLLTQARIRPYIKDGQAEGFILSYIKPDSFFTQLGLKRGDIIKSINSRPINTPEDAFSFYKAVESGEPLSMELIRGGQSTTINYQFR